MGGGAAEGDVATSTLADLTVSDVPVAGLTAFHGVFGTAGSAPDAGLDEGDLSDPSGGAYQPVSSARAGLDITITGTFRDTDGAVAYDGPVTRLELGHVAVTCEPPTATDTGTPTDTGTRTPTSPTPTPTGFESCPPRATPKPHHPGGGGYGRHASA
ncbi:hypothetical protein [Streptomyces sp. NPDC087270]|uniref:hypothetical protein n=1 Tax=Streptomyces sp. NPDC087270 TaxID=3365774 RepID=UPI0037F63EFB